MASLPVSADTQRLRPPRPAGSTPAAPRPAPEPSPSLELTPLLLNLRLNVPGYEVLEEVGRGGTAVVYKARHLLLDRLVALKVLRDGEASSPDQRARLLAEAAAVARLDHPNVVQIHEAGEVQGRTFLALEFVEGGSLADRLHGTPLPVREAARLVLTLAQAVQAAHDIGIVHRDLKPANVLLQRTEDRGRRTDKTGPSVLCPLPSVLCPKITDFGLAKRVGGDSQLTQTGEILGTPGYMAPEQAVGRHEQVGPATDVYALGAILYQLLTGKPPFIAESAVETLWLVCSDEPVPPRRLQPKLPRDLETVCLKCLNKEPHRRYASAQALADDLQRFLDGRSVRARATPAWERGLKWARRRPAVAGLAAACVLLAVLGLALVLWQWGNAEAAQAVAQSLAAREAAARSREADERRRAEAALERAVDDLYALHIASAEREWLGDDAARAVQLLEQCPPALRRWEWGHLRRAFRGSRLTLAGHEGGIQALALSRGARRVASAGLDGTVRLWSADDGAPLLTFRPGPPMSSLAFSPDGKTLAVGGRDGLVRLCDSATGRELRTLGKRGEWPCSVAFSPDGRLLAAAVRHPDVDATPCPVLVWDVETGEEVRRLAGHKGSVLGVAFHPGGRLLGSGSYDRTAIVWDVTTGEAVHTLRGHGDPVTAVSFGGERLATASLDHTARLWDVATGEPLGVCGGHAAGVAAAALWGDGSRLITASWDCTLRVWAEDGRPLQLLRGHTGWLRAAVVSADGRTVASAGDDGVVKVWAAEGGRPEVTEIHAEERDWLPAVAFHPSGRQFLSVGDSTVKTWDAATGRPLLAVTVAGKGLRAGAYAPDGQSFAAAGEAGVWVWKADGELRYHLTADHGDAIRLAYSPDGARLATAGEDGTVRLWRASDGRQLGVLRGHEGRVSGVAFSPDGKLLASAGRDGTVRLWDAETGLERLVFRGHSAPVECMAFHPDGRRLVSAAGDADRRDRPGELLLWDAQTGQILTTFPGTDQAIWTVAFHPDGTRLATGSDVGGVTVWEVPRGRPLLSLRGHRDDVRCVAFSPDGRLLISSDDLGVVRIAGSD